MMLGVVEGRQAHWDAAYEQGETNRSWFQGTPTVSLELLESAGVGVADPIVDIGGGAARLVDGLLARGYTDLTVLDVSPVSLGLAQRRLGGRAAAVTWLAQDLLSWAPTRRYAAWHDRAVLHFLVSEPQRAAYREVLAAATGPGSVAVLGTFGPHGPDRCSGLPVSRYDAAQLTRQAGPGWTLLASREELHRTPSGGSQQFTWVVLRRDRIGD